MGERVDWRLLAGAGACVVGAVALGLWIPTYRDVEHDLGVDLPAAGTPLDFPPPAAGSPSSGETSHPAEVDALSSPPGADGLTELVTRHAEDGPGGVYSQSFGFEQLESPQEAVLATTLDLWNSEALKTLTLAEVRALLYPEAGADPVPPGTQPPGGFDYDLTGDGLLLDRIGGLPTEEDVIDALDHPGVVDALNKFLVADGIALEFALRNQLPEIRKDAIRARDAAQDGLFQSLDRASGYRHWALLGAVWRALDRE